MIADCYQMISTCAVADDPLDRLTHTLESCLVEDRRVLSQVSPGATEASSGANCSSIALRTSTSTWCDVSNIATEIRAFQT